MRILYRNLVSNLVAEPPPRLMDGADVYDRRTDYFLQFRLSFRTSRYHAITWPLSNAYAAISRFPRSKALSWYWYKTLYEDDREEIKSTVKRIPQIVR